MNASPSELSPAPVENAALPFRPGVIALLWVSLLLISWLRAPVPGVNEPHYLSKAKHYWNPGWCAGDIFLESENAHLFFYQTVGWLTLFASLEVAAWVGRAVALLLLAWGWERLVSRLIPFRGAAVWSLWLWLGLTGLGNFSGEWLVGGVEGKVFAWALLLWGLGELLQRRWVTAGGCFGLSMSFHPLVGGWGALAAGFALLTGGRSAGTEQNDVKPAGLRRWLFPGLGLLALLLTALPGMWPALQMVGPTSAEAARDAAYVQVFYRLGHHLDPLRFSVAHYLGYAVLLLLWLLMRRRGAFPRDEPFFARFVVASVIVAGAGVLAGLGPRPGNVMPFYELRIQFLRFYPFRLFDGLLPMATAISGVAAGWQWLRTRPKESDRQRWQRIGWGLAALALLAAGGLALRHPDRNPGLLTPEEQTDWRAVCAWVKEHVPEGETLITPPPNFGFKWYAQRPEYATFKDCPQDAVHLLEWNARLVLIEDWAVASAPGGFSRDELLELNKATGCRYLLIMQRDKLPLPLIYENPNYKLYDFAALEK